jgi:O-acetyl-ADP-ribose deacetylase (regulator of RNase III)
MTRITIEQGDLTTKDVDAIVNAANNELQLGGGLAGAIRRAGGPAIQEACDDIGSIEVGQAALTTAGELPAKYVIHQASMSMGTQTTPDALRDSTHAVLRIAEQQGEIRTLAFPATGTGIAGFSLNEAADIMITEVLNHVHQSETTLEEVVFVLFDEQARRVFQDAYDRIKDRYR